MKRFHEACTYADLSMGVQDVKEKCRRDFLSAYAAELVFWPAFQAVNFWKVPVRHQLLAVNMACLLDATFLCWCGMLLSDAHPTLSKFVQEQCRLAPCTVHLQC